MACRRSAPWWHARESVGYAVSENTVVWSSRSRHASQHHPGIAVNSVGEASAMWKPSRVTPAAPAPAGMPRKARCRHRGCRERRVASTHRRESAFHGTQHAANAPFTAPTCPGSALPAWPVLKGGQRGRGSRRRSSGWRGAQRPASPKSPRCRRGPSSLGKPPRREGPGSWEATPSGNEDSYYRWRVRWWWRASGGAGASLPVGPALRAAEARGSRVAQQSGEAGRRRRP